MEFLVRISSVTATPVRVPIYAPRLHSDGVTRSLDRIVIEVRTDEGVTGLGELGGRSPHARVRAAGDDIVGLDPFATEELRGRLTGGKFADRGGNILYAGFEMALLDIQGKTLGRPVSDLLGGQLRTSVPTTAYVFRLLDHDGRPAVRTADDIVAETERLVAATGCTTIKFKAGSAAWAEDVAVTLALRDRFRDHQLRVDPNAVWSLGTSLRAAAQLAEADLEWLEDPVLGIEGMSQVTARGGIPTATNMCLTDWPELPAAVAAHAVDVVLLDIYYLGGMRSAAGFARACAAWQLGIGLHSGGAGASELGIGTAAVLQLAAALPTLIPAMDSMYSHVMDDVIVGGPLTFRDGSLTIPQQPGLGVELDADKLAHYASVAAEATSANRRGPSSHGGKRPQYPAY
ncbi:enolase C-terminal domain-like protein [Jiangella asiatica]|uniref:enolase C-terminal domain-like protein n=1 Tax=Jiangella asiatica TaxID=2530372 RepID=UPI0023AEE9CE|nr:enolase C-terminal domain-like protein [Jiangella asiatica]